MRVLMLFLLAARDLVRQRRRTASLVALATVGIVAVLFTRSWQRGMLEQLEREGAYVWLGAVEVLPPKSLESRNAFSLSAVLPIDQEVMRRLAAVDGVAATAPRIRFFGKLFKGDRSAPMFGLALDVKTAHSVVPRMLTDERLESGRLPKAPNEILVAAPLAASLGIVAGDTATILARPKDGGLEGRDVVVTGLLRAAFEENQRRAVVVDLGLASEMLRMQGLATEILVDVQPLSRAREIAAILPARVAPAAIIEAAAWDEINPRYQAARVVWSTSLGVMFVIVLLVAALGLSTTLHLIVTERAKEIATLSALGLPGSAIRTMFLFEGALVGALGGISGATAASLLVAVAHARGVSFHPPGGFVVRVQPFLTSGDLFAAVAIAIALGGVVAALAAWRSTRRSPPELLR